MNTFLVIAAVMAAIAAGVVALPLLRRGQSRVIGAVAAVLVIGASGTVGTAPERSQEWARKLRRA